jgi:2-dehydro-3-deoxygluconokinase
MTGSVACVGEPLIVFSTRSMADSPTAAISEGGAEFNVAVHLSRLGLPVRFVGAVGDDILGRRIQARLVREGVDVRALHLEPGGRTGAYVREWTPAQRTVSYLRAGSAASRLVPAPDSFVGVRHVHLSGITAALSEHCVALLDRLLAKPRPYSVSFDVNHRAKLWSAEVAADCLARMAAAADLVLVGRDEAEDLWGTLTPNEVRRRLPDPPELVVKDDGREAVAWSGPERVGLAPAPVEIVDPVGAGDAFAAGYLYARLHGHAPLPALASGHRLAREALQALDDLGRAVRPDERGPVLDGAR